MNGNEDDGSLIAQMRADNEIERIRRENAARAMKASREFCLNPDCEDEIPVARQKAIPGVEYCVDCADKHAKKAIRPNLLRDASPTWL